MPASSFASSQINPPDTWQAFEKGSATLWRKILAYDSVQRFGRQGQAQYGIDLHGYRNGDPSRLVAIQCKQKGIGKQATEGEFRKDFGRALSHFPNLTEYFFTTTAPDDAPLMDVAQKLTAEMVAMGNNILVHFWGWDTVSERLHEFPEAASIFDPAYSPFAVQSQLESQSQHAEQMTLLKHVSAQVEANPSLFSTDATGSVWSCHGLIPGP